MSVKFCSLLLDIEIHKGPISSRLAMEKLWGANSRGMQRLPWWKSATFDRMRSILKRLEQSHSFCLSGLSFPFVKDDWSIYPGGRAVEVHSNCTIANPIPGQMAWARNGVNLVWNGSRGKRVRLLHCPESQCCYHLPPLRQSGLRSWTPFSFCPIRRACLDHWLGLRSRSPGLMY